MRAVTPRRLGVNVDHVATLRQARGTPYPDPLQAAREAVRAGAYQITVHLREDRRHIQDWDVMALKRALSVPLNLEMAATADMRAFAARLRPHAVTLVPERRAEQTTEGGLDLFKTPRKIATVVTGLKQKGIRLSAFIEANPKQVGAARTLGFDAVEFHTGHFCTRYDGRKSWKRELADIARAARLAAAGGLSVVAGHGINTHNIHPLLRIREIEEYNIGHSIVADAVVIGFYEAVRKMQSLISV